jgi:hypothetical protein
MLHPGTFPKLLLIMRREGKGPCCKVNLDKFELRPKLPQPARTVKRKDIFALIYLNDFFPFRCTILPRGGVLLSKVDATSDVEVLSPEERCRTTGKSEHM